MGKAKVVADKNGKIKVVDNNGKSHSTPFKVMPGSSKTAIEKMVKGAINMHKTKPGVAALYGKASSIANKIHNQMQGKEKEPETKKETKPKEKKPKAKKEKKGKTKTKPSKTTPKKKTVTVSISGAALLKVMNLAEKKKDKKLRDELSKLAESFVNLDDYVQGNAGAVTAEVFNNFYTNEYFELYVNGMALEDPAFEELISVTTDKKLAKNSGSGLLELADNAIRSFISSEMNTNSKLSKEMEAIGGLNPVGQMNGRLFLASVLYLRRLNNPNASLLKLDLAKAAEKTKEKEKPKVEYRLK